MVAFKCAESITFFALASAIVALANCFKAFKFITELSITSPAFKFEKSFKTVVAPLSELKTILKSNPQNKIILNDAGDIILNDSIKIKDIVLKKELVPTILYGTDGKVLRKIDPKEIEKVFVRKSGDENFIEIIKKDSSIIKIFKSEKGIPNIDKKVTTAKMPTVKNNITLKNGYSIYTDKNGVEHKIISSEIDKVYITNNKNNERK